MRSGYLCAPIGWTRGQGSSFIQSTQLSLPGRWTWWIQRDNIQHSSCMVLSYCNRKGCRLPLLVHLDQDRTCCWVPSLLARRHLRNYQLENVQQHDGWKPGEELFLLWEGFKKMPLTLVLCNEVCSVMGRSSPCWQCLQEDPRLHGRKQLKSGECVVMFCV